jgi:archaellum component FlaC
MINLKIRASLFVLASLTALGAAVPAALAREDPGAAAGAAQDAPRYQYVWRHDKSYSNRTTDPAVRTALQTLAEAQSGDCIVVERAGRRYLITDPYILQHAEEAYAPVTALGGQMGGIGKQMDGIGKQMDGVGKQMNDIGKEMNGVGKQMNDLGKQMQAAKEAGDDAQMAQLKQQMQGLRGQMQGLGEKMKPLGEQMKPLGEQMKPLGEQMKPLGEKMRAAVPDAEAKMTRLLDTAFLRQMAAEQK